MEIDWVQVANALVVLILGLAAGFGWRSKGGAKDEPKVAPGAVEVAGALVDSSSIKQVTIEISNLASATVDHTEELREVRHSINRLREAIDRQAMEMARKR